MISKIAKLFLKISAVIFIFTSLFFSSLQIAKAEICNNTCGNSWKYLGYDYALNNSSYSLGYNYDLNPSSVVWSNYPSSNYPSHGWNPVDYCGKYWGGSDADKFTVQRAYYVPYTGGCGNTLICGPYYVYRYSCVPPPSASYSLKCSGELYSAGKDSKYTNIKWTAIPGPSANPKTYSWGGDVLDTNYGGGDAKSAVAYTYSKPNTTGKVSITGTGIDKATGQVVKSSNTDNTCTLVTAQKLSATCNGAISDSPAGNVTFTAQASINNSTSYTWNIGGVAYTGQTVTLLATPGQTINASVTATAKFKDPRDTYTIKSSNANNTCRVVVPTCSSDEAFIGGACGLSLNKVKSFCHAVFGVQPIKCEGSVESVLQDLVKKLKLAAINDSAESGYVIVQFSDGSVNYYPADGSDSSVSYKNAINQIKNSENRSNDFVEKVITLHSHPNKVIENYGMYYTPVGYPPSGADFRGNVAIQSDFPEASISGIAVDGTGKVWEYSTAKSSNLYSDLVEYMRNNYVNTPDMKFLNNVVAYDLGRFVNYYGSGDSTLDYIKVARKAGGMIKNVTAQYK